MAQLQGGNELVMFQGSASNICSWNYRNEWQISLCQQRQNRSLALFWPEASSSSYESFSSPNTAVLQHPRLWWKIWCDIYPECLIRLALTEWDFPLWSPAALSVLSPHSYLCQPAEKLSISLSVLPVLSSWTVCIIMGSSNSLWRTNTS